MMTAEDIMKSFSADMRSHMVIFFENTVYSADEYDEYLWSRRLSVAEMRSIPIFGSYIFVIKLEREE